MNLICVICGLLFDNKMDHEQLDFRKLRAGKRRAITEGRGLVTAEPLFSERTLPLLVKPSVSGLDPVAWATRNQDFIESSVRKHGGIRAVVEDHCRRNGIDASWKNDDRLRLRAVRRAIREHAYTGEEVWFNHATFFHISTLEPSVREALLEVAEDDLPANSYYGDGSPIEPEVLAELRRRYHEETVMFSWQRGDTLLRDNMLVAHGRAPFSGPRKIMVGMAQQFGERTDFSVQPQCSLCLL